MKNQKSKLMVSEAEPIKSQNRVRLDRNDRSKIKNLFVLVLILLSTFYFLLSGLVLADEAGDNDFVYLFHLYYDNGQLFADRDFKFNYDVIPEEFIQEVYNTQFPFRGEVVNIRGELAAEFFFDSKHGDQKFTKGKISVKAPYFADGQKVVFYNVQNQSLLTIFVSESSFCNDDGICNSDKGEDNKTCPNDCPGFLPTTPPPPIEESPIKQISILKTMIYVLIIAGAMLGGWFGWKWWKIRKISQPQSQATNQFISKSS